MLHKHQDVQCIWASCRHHLNPNLRTFVHFSLGRKRACCSLSPGGRYGVSWSPEEGLEALLTGRYPLLASADNSPCNSMAIWDPISLFLCYRQPKCLIWAADAIGWLCFEMVGTDACIFLEGLCLFMVLGLMGLNCHIPFLDGEKRGCLCAINYCKPGMLRGLLEENRYACVRLVLLIGRVRLCGVRVDGESQI